MVSRPSAKKFIFDVASGKIAAFVDGVQLILRADVDDKFAALLDHLAAEIFVLNADKQQRRLIANPEGAKGELHVALALVGGRDQVETGGRDSVGLCQCDFLSAWISSE